MNENKDNGSGVLISRNEWLFLPGRNIVSVLHIRLTLSNRNVQHFSFSRLIVNRHMIRYDKIINPDIHIDFFVCFFYFFDFIQEIGD